MSSRSARSSSASRSRMPANGWPAKFWLKKFVASISCDGVYERSVCRMRFCTSPSGVTMISSTRRSDRRRNSRWRNDASRRFGVITTPANCVSCDSSGRGVDDLLRPVGVELAFEPVDLDVLERLHHHQAVDEKPVAARRRHAPGGRVRARDEAHLLEIGHHVADRRRRQLEARMARQRARADRLAVGDVALDQRLQQVLRAGIQHLVIRTSRRRDSCAPCLYYLAARSAIAPRSADRPTRRGARCGLIAAMPARPPERFHRIALIGRHGGPGVAAPLPRSPRSCSARGHAVVLDAETAQCRGRCRGTRRVGRRSRARRRRPRDRARRRRHDARRSRAGSRRSTCR